MSFECPKCGFKNSEIQSAEEIQERGAKYTLRLSEKDDFNRQVVKSDTCVAKFIELDVEIPSGRGRLTNVEGLLSMVLEDLEMEQPARRTLAPEVHEKIQDLIDKGRKMLDGEIFPCTLIVDDPAGNSWIEPSPKDKLSKWTRVDYVRTAEQNGMLSLGDAGGNELSNAGT